MSEYLIAENLPESINRTNLNETAQTVDREMHLASDNVPLALIYPKIDELAENVVDNLAVQLHVDFYDYTLPVAKKRALVKQSIAWHQIKGTKAAVEQVIQTVFNQGHVQEWFEYGGSPYHFRVDVIESDDIDAATIGQVVKAINSTKNVRSWLDGIGFYRRINQERYRGCIVTAGKTYVIGPPVSHDTTISSNVRRGVAVQTHREVVIS